MKEREGGTVGKEGERDELPILLLDFSSYSVRASVLRCYVAGVRLTSSTMVFP